jgi:hypothetical protein
LRGQRRSRRPIAFVKRFNIEREVRNANNPLRGSKELIVSVS